METSKKKCWGPRSERRMASSPPRGWLKNEQEVLRAAPLLQFRHFSFGTSEEAATSLTPPPGPFLLNR